MIINWLYVDQGFRNQHTTVSTSLHTIGRHTWIQYRKPTMALFPMSWDIVSTTKDSLHKVSIATRSGDRWVACGILVAVHDWRHDWSSRLWYVDERREGGYRPVLV